LTTTDLKYIFIKAENFFPVSADKGSIPASWS